MRFPWFPLLILFVIIVSTIIIFALNFSSREEYKQIITIIIALILFIFLIILFGRSYETKTINISKEGETMKYSI